MNDQVLTKAKASTERMLQRGLKLIFEERSNWKEIANSSKLKHLALGKFELLTENQYRANFSIGGMLYDFALTSYLNEYWIGIDDICQIILSDNTQLFKELNKKKNYKLGSEKGGWFGMQYALLQIADSDWSGLINTIKYLKTVNRPYDSLFHNIENYFQLYEGFLTKDTTKVQSSLLELEKGENRIQRQKLITFEKDISIITLALGRLAWMHGMEVEIDSKYVPKELLPFKPLEEYTIPYKFLRDFYRKQGLDWRYDPVHPELQNWENDPENPDRKKGGLFGKLFN